MKMNCHTRWRGFGVGISMRIDRGGAGKWVRRSQTLAVGFEMLPQVGHCIRLTSVSETWLVMCHEAARRPM